MAWFSACFALFFLPALLAPPPPHRLGALGLTRRLVDLCATQLAVPETLLEARHLQVLGNHGVGAAAVGHAGWVDAAVGVPGRRAKLCDI